MERRRDERGIRGKSRASGSDGAGAPGRVRFTVGGDLLDSAEDRLHRGDASKVEAERDRGERPGLTTAQPLRHAPRHFNHLATQLAPDLLAPYTLRFAFHTRSIAARSFIGSRWDQSGYRSLQRSGIFRGSQVLRLEISGAARVAGFPRRSQPRSFR